MNSLPREGNTVVVVIANGDGVYQSIDTGLSGMVDIQTGNFVIPYHSEMVAEEVARILAAQIRRDMAESEG